MTRPLPLPAALCALTLLAATAAAQVNVQWDEFVNQTASRLIAAPALGVSDPDEKDYAWGDVDHDGDLDLVCVRKEPVATLGKRINVLFRNEGIKDGRAFDGVLVDRTAQYATASDVPGDQGFLTPTNDRAVKLVDVDGDGWLDVVTCTTLSDGDPKPISHPRVYRNLGADAGGNWLGFRFEDFRFPQLLTVGNLPVAPRFCDVAAGDIDNDGDIDLYFADYDGTETNIAEPTAWDLNDRLLINDGTGVFTDQSAARMTTAMLSSAFAMACEIVDLNGDGARDIVKDTALGSPQYVSVAYNNPANVGYFNLFQNNAYTGSPYHVSVGDLNADGRPDLVVSDDGQDRYRLNTGNDALGRVVWSNAFAVTYVGGSDDGFAGENYVADLDNDGFPEAIITDVDVDVPGCSRRAHIFHNLGNVPNVTLREEAESTAPATGWKGVKGLAVADLTGTFSAAIFDLDGDGWKDLVLGRCTGTSVWINRPPGLASYGLGTPTSRRQMRLTGNRVPHLNTPSFALQVRGCPPGAAGFLAVSDTQDLTGTFLPPLGVTIHVGLASPIFTIIPLYSDTTGVATFPVPIPNDPALLALPPLYLQAGFLEGPSFRTSDGLRLTFQP